MSKKFINQMVDRFLCWKLPADFAPDCGISFDGREDDEWNKDKTWPVGTNLFTAEQAKQMFSEVVADDEELTSREETAWLIELEGPKWAGFVDGKPEWTTDPNRALRFARKEDADNFKAFWCMTAASTEHSWL